jgi:hypothetical protein
MTDEMRQRYVDRRMLNPAEKGLRLPWSKKPAEEGEPDWLRSAKEPSAVDSAALFSPDDELPISPVVLRWLAEYASATDRDKDQVVARMLSQLASEQNELSERDESLDARVMEYLRQHRRASQ